MEKRVYKCVKCGEVYETDWDEVDAIQEAVNRFGDKISGKGEMVCEDCYKELLSKEGESGDEG